MTEKEGKSIIKTYRMKTISKHHKTKEQIEEDCDFVLMAQKSSAAFEALYNKYHEQIFRFVYQRMDSEDNAYDITAQVFMKALSSIKKYTSKNLPFSAWLYTIAYNEICDFFKKHAQARCLNIDSVQLSEFVTELDDVSKDDLYLQVLEIMQGLPEDELALLEMRYFEYLSFKQIGHILSITENYAKVKLYRVIDTLKKMIK